MLGQHSSSVSGRLFCTRGFPAATSACQHLDMVASGLSRLRCTAVAELAPELHKCNMTGCLSLVAWPGWHTHLSLLRMILRVACAT